MSETRREAYSLPDIVLPPLDEVEVTVQAPEPPNAEELIERLHQRLRESAERRERKPGDLIQAGDEVECDIVTLVDGLVVPGSVKYGARLEMREFLHLPGFIEHLLSMQTFSADTFELQLPDDYPLAELSGKQATFYVEARRVFALEPAEMDDPVALRKAGLGEDIEQAMGALAAELDAELGDELLIEATQAVLDEVADQVEVEIPAAAIDEELRQLWQHTEGVVLQGRDFPREMISRAEEDFLRHPDLRAQVQQRIKIGLVLKALVAEQSLTPSEEVMTTLLDEAANAVQVTFGEAKAGLATDPIQAMAAGQMALYQTAVEYLMSRVKVRVEE